MSAVRKAGVPAAVICSTPFENLGRTQARIFGAGDLPLVLISHPLGGIEPERVRLRAAEATPRILQLLAEVRS